MSASSKTISVYVVSRLSALADPAKAALTAACMKTDVPFYGVQTRMSGYSTMTFGSGT